MKGRVATAINAGPGNARPPRCPAAHAARGRVTRPATTTNFMAMPYSTGTASTTSVALIAALCAGLTLGLAAPAWAGWGEGLAAYDQGDYATALREFQPLAEQGHAESQFKLGVMYFNGRGVARDFAKAMNWWRKAADQGHSEARKVSKLLLGGMNYAGAAEWYLKAAKQGNANAQYKLGFLYGTGGGA